MLRGTNQATRALEERSAALRGSRIRKVPMRKEAQFYRWPADDPRHADYLAHEKSYRNFVRGVQLSVALAAITLILLAVFLL